MEKASYLRPSSTDLSDEVVMHVPHISTKNVSAESAQ